MLMFVSTGEPGDLSAETSTWTPPSSMLLFLQTSAKIVTPQSARDMRQSSSAVGPRLWFREAPPALKQPEEFGMKLK